MSIEYIYFYDNPGATGLYIYNMYIYIYSGRGDGGAWASLAQVLLDDGLSVSHRLSVSRETLPHTSHNTHFIHTHSLSLSFFLSLSLTWILLT